MRKTALTIALGSLVAATGCTMTEDPELEGLTLAAGDAIAHNNSLQRIDPWAPGVQDPDLVVPVKRPATRGAAKKAQDYDKATTE